MHLLTRSASYNNNNNNNNKTLLRSHVTYTSEVRRGTTFGAYKAIDTQWYLISRCKRNFETTFHYHDVLRFSRVIILYFISWNYFAKFKAASLLQLSQKHLADTWEALACINLTTMAMTQKSLDSITNRRRNLTVSAKRVLRLSIRINLYPKSL